MAVPEDSLPVELLITVLTVPSLDLVPRVFRRCESGRHEASLSRRSGTYELRYWYDAIGGCWRDGCVRLLV